MNLDAQLAVTRADFVLDVRLAVSAGRTLALLGPNGAGKSTALAALAGLVENHGQIRLGERVLDRVPVEQRRIGFVFQDYLLFPHLSVLENVAFGVVRARSDDGRRSASRAASRAVAMGWLDRMGIADLASRRPREISGGQAQRVALARALAIEPELLLLDEPLAALDVEVRAEVREELAGHLTSWGGLTIVVTHSLDDVAALASDVVVLERGRATQRATVRELVREPATAYVERLVSAWRED